MAKEFIVICAWCKSYETMIFKVKRSETVWSFMIIPEINGYQFSHGICPDCLEKEREKMAEEKTEQEAFREERWAEGIQSD